MNRCKIDDMKVERKRIKEEWREVPGYPGFEASSLGEIRRDGEVCKQTPPAKGYPYHSVYVPTSMTKKKTQSWECVYTLVILAFHGSRPQGKVW